MFQIPLKHKHYPTNIFWSLRRLKDRKIVTVKTSSRRLQEMSSRHFFKDVFKACLEDALKTNKILIGNEYISLTNKS